jgi:two-component system CheB/CheR fusion protein
VVIIGIGGSAGSLAPLRELLAALPADTGMAFVVVTHQAPSGKSLLPELLGKTTEMPVRELDGATRALPDHVYVAPRGHSLRVHDAVLAIEAVGDPSRVPLPIDSFFRSLAQDRRRGAVGIILSGTGSDGTLGLAAIRTESGLCLAQDPETAEFDGMPTSAITAQATDFVLPVREMPARLLAYARSIGATPHDGVPSDVSSLEMERILALIRVRGGHDFSAYRRETLHRRVERRMDLQRIERLADYARYLEKNDQEIDALWRDWLIGVSAFFREPEAFEALAKSGLQPLLAARRDDAPLRVWVPGCATGEEAYSIAIALLEALETFGERLDVQVFATDLDPAAIQTARAGRYPKSIAEAVGARRLDRYFVEEEHAYRAKKELRDRIVFAVQDVLQDPPFTRLDLISCRNLLIYVVPSAQQSLLAVFHYSLNPGGLLLLGASEHIGGSTELFSTLDKRWKLFRRDESAAARPPFRWTPRALPATDAGVARPLAEGRKLDLTQMLRTCLAERFGPPAVVVDLRGQIQQTHGRVGPYLELPPGRANLNVLDMAREGLRAPLGAALRALTKGEGTSVEKVVRVKTEASWLPLRLTVARIEDRRLPGPLLLVSFEPASSRAGSSRKRTPSSKRRRPGPAQLEEELQHVRQDLQVSISELQAANEELASAHEEVQSANEELQSSNEELQTSKEEAQSLNEELQTVNAELTEKLRGLEQANDDLLNLMSNFEIATIFLDDRLRVKRFTPQARSVARLIDSDVGRPLADLATPLDYPDLLADAGSVLASLRPLEKQAAAPGGVWYTVRIRPYRTARNAVEGLVVTFIDITETKRAERVQAARSLAESIVDAVHEPLLVLDSALRVVRANRSFYRAFRVEPPETEGQRVDELGSHQWSIPGLRGLLEATLRDGAPFEGFEVVHEFPHLGRRRMLLSGGPVSVQGDATPVLIVLGIRDAGHTPAGIGAEDGDA